MTVTQGQLLGGLDPHDHVNTPDGNILRQTYENLVARQRDGTVTARLATEWNRVEAGRVRFQIREGVTFHNGDALTPEDVAFSINRIVRNGVGITSPQQSTLEPITGAEVVDGQRAVDVLSNGYNPILLDQLASFFGQVMEKSWVQSRSTAEINRQANGTGPFQLESYQSDVHVTFTRYDDYWREPAAINRLRFTAASESSTRVNQLLEGETDVVVNVPPQEVSRIRSADGRAVEAAESTRLVFAAMRYDVEPFSSVAFRRAMNYAVDLESIVENVLAGFGAPTGQPTLDIVFGHNPNVEPYPHDPARAERLVEESGHAGASITLHTPVGRYLKDIEIAQAVANAIDGLSNVSCSVRQREFGPLVEEVASGDITTSPPFYLIGWANEMFDASVSIGPVLTSDGVSTSFENERLDSLMRQASQARERQQRKRLFRRANKLCHDQAPWVYLNQQFSVYGLNTRLQWTPRRDEFIYAYEMGFR
ncbi:ABC transporter substrate-binding protein [Halorussus rarus]|uniref:ABC transporter substrate-binding protein n=1 Tax=Halorussus TaxID=1070314 RepID=UPI001F07885A|nr:ABC transporter substrate-binding protein [Halorussus rarus]